MPVWLVELVKQAAPLGGATALALVIAALAAWTLRGWYKARLEILGKAIEKAKPDDVPGLVRDEIATLKISARNLTKAAQGKAVLLALEQRENRSKRTFKLLLVIAVLVATVAIIGILIPDVSDGSRSRSEHVQEQPNFGSEEKLSRGGGGERATQEIHGRAGEPSGAAKTIMLSLDQYIERAELLSARDDQDLVRHTLVWFEEVKTYLYGLGRREGEILMYGDSFVNNVQLRSEDTSFRDPISVQDCHRLLDMGIAHLKALRERFSAGLDAEGER